MRARAAPLARLGQLAGRRTVVDVASGAEVLVDQKAVGSIGGDGSFSESGIAPGEHSIELRRENFIAKRLQRQFTAGQTVQLAGVDVILAAAVGIGDTLAFFVFASALERGPTWAVSLLSSLGPIIVVLGGYLGYGERLRAAQLVGLGSIALGILLATLPAR